MTRDGAVLKWRIPADAAPDWYEGRWTIEGGWNGPDPSYFESIDLTSSVNVYSTTQVGITVLGQKEVLGAAEQYITIKLHNRGAQPLAKNTALRIRLTGPVVQGRDGAVGCETRFAIDRKATDFQCGLPDQLAPGKAHEFAIQVRGTGPRDATAGSLDLFVVSRSSRGPGIGTTEPLVSRPFQVVPHQPRIISQPVVIGEHKVGRRLRCAGGETFPADAGGAGFRWHYLFEGGKPGQIKGPSVMLTPSSAGARIYCRRDIKTPWGNVSLTTKPTPVLSALRFRGTRANEQFYGDHRRTVIIAGGGNDLAVGGGGSDVIDLGPGNDTAYGGSGHDTISCGSGKDGVDAGGGSDTINCRDGSGNDIVICGVGRDTATIDRGDYTRGCERVKRG